MGSFGGHALPGSFFILVGLYWTVQFYRKFFQSLRKGAKPFYATVTFSCNNDHVDPSAIARLSRQLSSAGQHDNRRRTGCCCDFSNVDWEGVTKMFFAFVGFCVEVIFAMVPTGQFTGFSPAQHATMFFFFGLSGVVDVLVKLRSPILPFGSEYFFGTLAFIVEALLFTFHLHGRSSMDVLVHNLLIYVLYSTVVVVLLEAKYRRVPLFVFIRAFLVILQGTWFWQVGFILYKPLPGSEPWNREDHAQIMVVTLMFMWHMVAVLTVMVAIGSFVHISCYRRVPAADQSFADVEATDHDQIHLLPKQTSSSLTAKKFSKVFHENEEDF